MLATIKVSTTQVINAPSMAISQKQGKNAETAILMQMIKSKSERGFNTFYRNYHRALYGVLFKYVRRPEIADELLQDTFVKIWKHIDSFDPSRGSLYTWMLNVAQNLAIDHLRSAAHRKQSLNVDLDSASLSKNYKSKITLNASEAEFNDFKNKALELNAKYAEVIDMIFFYGWSHEQTAQLLKLPLGTVKTRARKGLGFLKILYHQ